MNKLIKRNRRQKLRQIKLAGRNTTEISLMYPSQKKDLMLVFERKRMMGVVFPNDLFRYAQEIDDNRNTAIIKRNNLRRILRSKQYYYQINGFEL